MSLDQNFIPHFSEFDSHLFRTQRLWREEIDVLYTRFLPGLKIVYEKNTGKLAMPGMQRIPMSLDEFIEIFDTAGLIDDNFGQR